MGVLKANWATLVEVESLVIRMIASMLGSCSFLFGLARFFRLSFHYSFARC